MKKLGLIFHPHTQFPLFPSPSMALPGVLRTTEFSSNTSTSTSTSFSLRPVGAHTLPHPRNTTRHCCCKGPELTE